MYSSGKKSIQHAIKGIMVATALLLVNAISLDFLDLLITGGVAYWQGIKEGSYTHAKKQRMMGMGKERGRRNEWMAIMNFAVMLHIYYKDGCHPQNHFLNTRLQSSKARISTGPNLSLKSSARLRPSYLTS